MAIPSWKLIPALVCGNTVVLKSGEDVPLSALNLVKSCEEAGIPKGVVNLVNGHGADVGNPLVNHKDVRLISFTGSTNTGRIIAEQCANLNKIVSLEMGGKNALLSWTTPTLTTPSKARCGARSERAGSAARLPRALSFTKKFIRNSARN
jgi:aldehyde dehydrogenase (NAD+)